MSDKEDLFPDAHSDSPRLAWLKRHDLMTVEQPLPRREIGPRNSMPWCCHNASKTVCMFGEDEVDATMLYAKVMGIVHYLLDSYEQRHGAADAQAGEDWSE